MGLVVSLNRCCVDVVVVVVVVVLFFVVVFVMRETNSSFPRSLDLSRSGEFSCRVLQFAKPACSNLLLSFRYFSCFDCFQ